MVKKAAVFLDRDGVLNHSDVVKGKPYAPRRVEDFRLYDESLQATQSLKDKGFFLVVITNQPDVGNGYVEQNTVEQMNKIMTQTLPLDDVKVCFHAQTDNCDCRKPKPGMLLQAIEENNIDPTISYMIGDRFSDIMAGKAAGCRTIFIDRNYAETKSVEADHIVKSLEEAALYIVTHSRKE